MKNIICLLSLLMGTFGTHFLINVLHLPPVLSSASIGLFASIAFYKPFRLPPTIGIAMYCGSFIGMGSELTSIELFLASIVATFLLLFSSSVFVGYGGKLGLMAYVSSILIGFLKAITTQSFTVTALFQQLSPITTIENIIAICCATILGFYSTIYLHHTKRTSAVFASAFPSFLISWFVYTDLPAIHLFVSTFYSITFAGMLAEDLLPKNRYPLLLIVLILITIFLKNGLGGFGGSLGTMAFLSVYILSLFSNKSFSKIN